MIRFTCSHCGETYEVATEHAGKKSKCAKCKSPITVPASSASRTKSAATPPVISTPTSVTQPASPSVHVSLDQNKPTGTQGFLRAFGITSGFMAAVAAVVIGIPILACGGCLVSMIGIGATVDTTPRTTSGLSNTTVQTLSSERPPDSIPDPEAIIDTEAESNVASQETIVVETLPIVDLSDRPNVYTFDGMTATVKDQHINDVRIVDVDGRPITVDVLLENSSGANWKPSLTLEFVNAYGVVLGYDSIAWALDELAPNKRYTESVDFYARRFDDIFRYSPITRPVDFDEPKYLILTYR